ncbi:cupin domain-containing protein [Vibrio sp. V38_P2S17PM301]|nr:cupin domain-containing protein [Vibrio sp. V36_P2S2PM302]NAX27852.1 cupin domain-containing protein [Vibrio sp. V38_P2S17PM301]NAX32361.1 cupin domain-containing protein [Vibrio sp. V37_P2S8PM304]
MNKKACAVTLAALMFNGGWVSSSYAGESPAQQVYRGEELKSFIGPDSLFTGHVQVDMLFPENDVANYSAAYVTFQPGARSAWHSHPAGQHIIVTSGVALKGTRDGNVIRFSEGESVWCPPGVEHWHGATPEAAMTHLVVTASKDGQNAIWKEKVTDEQYLGSQ